jgi:hypothetical protein
MACNKLKVVGSNAGVGEVAGVKPVFGEEVAEGQA